MKKCDPSPTPLTDREEEILMFLVGFALTHLYQPSVRQIADAANMSWSTVAETLRGIASSGWIRKAGNRCWEVTDEALEMFVRWDARYSADEGWWRNVA